VIQKEWVEYVMVFLGIAFGPGLSLYLFITLSLYKKDAASVLNAK